MSETARVCVREARPSDHEFIINAWRASLMHAARGFQGADRKHAEEEFQRIAAHYLTQAKVLVVSDSEDEDNNLAFAIFTGNELHYIYVAEPYRRKGLVSRLLEGVDIKRYTFATPVGERRLHAHERGWKYTPRWTLKRTA